MSNLIKDNYVRSAEVRRVIDGDTIEVLVDSGFKYYTVERIQVAGIRTDDIVGENKTERGLKAKEYVEDKLPEGSKVIIQSHGVDGFGRWVCDVYYRSGEGQLNLGVTLLCSGLVDELD